MPEKVPAVKDLPDRGTGTGVSDSYGADLSGSATNKEGTASGAAAGPENPGCADDGSC